MLVVVTPPRRLCSVCVRGSCGWSVNIIVTVAHRLGGSLSLVIVYVCEIARGGQELLQLRG